VVDVVVVEVVVVVIVVVVVVLAAVVVVGCVKSGNPCIIHILYTECAKI